MVILETVEDFEKVKKVLSNPNSSEHEYCIKVFGFCSFCDQITQYLNSSNLEIPGAYCLKCRKTYKYGSYRDYMKNNPNPSYIINLPHESDTGEKIKYLNSRRQQMVFFQEVLDKFITDQKAIERKAKNAVRRLARLRS